MKKLLLTTALSLVAVSAVAEMQPKSGFYAGGGVAHVKMSFDKGESLDDEGSLDTEGDSQDDEGGSLSWTTYEAIGGYKHSPFVGGEARIGFGSDDADLMYSSFYYRTESVNETAKTYLLLGYTFGVVKLDADPGEDDTVNLSGFSYGAGVGFPVSPRLNVNLEYRVIINGKSKYEGDSENMELKGMSLNVDYRF
jgi:opacity protein-like surface antigen